MASARLLPVIMGLTSTALLLIFILSLSCSPLPSLCFPSLYTFPSLKSMCVDYICSLWSLLHRYSTDQQPTVLISSRTLFLLVNLIILFLLISLHLQQHSAPPVLAKRSSRNKKQQPTVKLFTIVNDKQAAVRDDHPALPAAAAMAKEALCAELDTLIAEAVPMQENSVKKLDEAQEFPTVDSDRIDGSAVEQIVLEEDGRLRLIGGVDTIKGSDAEEREGGRVRLIESGNGSGAEKIVLEEDGRLRLIEPNEGSDAEKIVLEEDGRLRLIDTPQLPSSSCRPRKSHSTGDKNVDELPSGNCDTQSFNNFNYDIIHTQDSLNHNDSNHNELNNGPLVLDLSCNPSNTHNLNHDDAQHSSLSNDNHKSSSANKRTSSRPIRVKKSDSLDATWKAISNKSSAANNTRDHNKHLIRQSSRQDFKPSSRGLTRASNNSKVRREPSISQEELNAKVESFIAKFNEQIRIQRQQSLLSYMQMVDRGS